MDTIIDVNTGQVKVCRGNISLRSPAIGSCIVVAAYDSKTQTGGMAHIMLPHQAPQKAPIKTRYAHNAIVELRRQMIEEGVNPDDIEVCLIGGGNVLKKENDTICIPNIESATQILKEHNIPIRASVVGGTERKNAFVDITKGTISYTKGDGPKTVLWTATEASSARHQ